MLKLRVIMLCNSLQECEACGNGCTLANDEFPHLLEQINDTCEEFVVAGDGQYWDCREFFNYHNLTTLWVIGEELSS